MNMNARGHRKIIEWGYGTPYNPGWQRTFVSLGAFLLAPKLLEKQIPS